MPYTLFASREKDPDSWQLLVCSIIIKRRSLDCGPVDASAAMGKVVLYMTSTPTTLKLKHDIKRIQELLAAKQIPHEEVRVV